MFFIAIVCANSPTIVRYEEQLFTENVIPFERLTFWDENYCDVNHLNARTADKFSKIIADIVQNLKKISAQLNY